MSKKKKQPAKKNGIKTFISFLRKDEFRYALALAFLFIAIYMLFSFISYFFHWESDQDFMWERVFTDASLRVNNNGGKLGAWLSDLFINKWFGLASLLFPFIIIVWAIRLSGFKLFKTKYATRNSLILIILTSVGLGFIFGSASGYLGSGPGGAHGYHISRWLVASLGVLGTSFILLLSYALFFLFATPLLSSIRVQLKKRKESSEKPGKEDVIDDNENEPANSIPDLNAEDDDDGFVVTEPKEELQPETKSNESEEDDVKMTLEKSEEEESDHGNGTTGELQDYDPTLDLPNYKLPPLSILNEYDAGDTKVTNDELLSNKKRIVETLASYKIKIDKIKATIGPTVTLYEIVPAPGIRISKIKNLEDDIALSLAALGIRIIAPIPGKGTIGIEVPNLKPRTVSMRSILNSSKFRESEFDLTIALGKTISNETFTFDLAKMPHLLVAGATGQGKSVGLNAIIASLLYKKHPAQLKFVMIDPKKVELSLYSKIEKHFLAKLEDTEEAIITDTDKVVNTLNALCSEMDARYKLLQTAKVRNIKEYNSRFISRRLNPEKGHRYLPFIVVVIDEFADLIMTAGRNIEHPIMRLAQLARAIGIHLVIATQRPTTNIITGGIKGNFPARIAFRVSSSIDSRTILDGPGADQLIGRGDMLFLSGNEPVRIQCAFIDTPELDDITDFISEQKGYTSALELKAAPEEVSEGPSVDMKKRDDLFEEVARMVVDNQVGSTSYIQRKMSLGYNRAGRIVDQLEAAGIVGKADGSKPRQVLIKDSISLEQILNELE